MVRKLYDFAVGIPPNIRLFPLTAMAVVGLMQGMVVLPSFYLAACAVILINKRKR